MSQDFALDYEGNCTVEQFSELSAAAQKRVWKTARWNGWVYILAAGAIYFVILYGIYLFSQSLDRAAVAIVVRFDIPAGGQLGQPCGGLGRARKAGIIGERNEGLGHWIGPLAALA